MNHIIPLIEKEHEPRVNSRVLAEHLGISHEAVLKTIDKHLEILKSHGQLRFEIGVISKKGAGQKTRTAFLNESQSYFILTLSRNTSRVVELKSSLVKAFDRFRREQQNATDYLPFYHDLHDAIKMLTEYAQANGSKQGEHVFHQMYNKLINKACGIEAGQRQNLSVNTRVNITNATAAVITTIKRGIESGTDYHVIYQQAKAAVKSVTYTGNALTTY